MAPLPRYARTHAHMKNSATAQQYANPPLSYKQRKQVKNIARNTQERKRSVNTGSAAMKEGSWYVLNPLYNITQGLTNSTRIGPSMNLDSLDVRYQFVTDPTSNAEVSLRAAIWWTDVESITTSSNPTQVTTPNLLTTLPLVGAVTSEQANILAFDPFQCTVVRDILETVVIPFSTGPGRYSGVFRVKFKGKKCTYLADVASYLEGKNLYVGFSSSNNGVVDSTNTGTVFHNTKVNFRE